MLLVTFKMQGFTQELTERVIKNAWEAKRIASAYLFFGPASTGRLSLARRLAKTVNCERGLFPPCLACLSCRRIENNNYPDVHYVQKENSNFIKIEQIHQMQKEIFLHSFEGKCKVFIILDAGCFTDEAANCLLKVLEEPPGDSLIILIASDLCRILPTIISRCQNLRFHPRDRHSAEAVLNRDYHLQEKLSHFLAFAFEGRLSEALKYKDHDTLSEKNRIIKHFITTPGASFTKFDSRDKDKLKVILNILIGCARDIYLLKAGINRDKLINEDITDELSSVSERFSFIELDGIFQQLCNSLESIRQNINPRLLIDSLGLLWRK